MNGITWADIEKQEQSTSIYNEERRARRAQYLQEQALRITHEINKSMQRINDHMRGELEESLRLNKLFEARQRNMAELAEAES